MSSFIIGVLVGAVIGYFACCLMTGRKQDEYEEKLWELERKLWSAEYEDK